jgi:chromate transport protein ChrA
VGIIVMSAKKLTEKSVGKDKLLWAIYLVLACVTIATESEIAWLFIAAGMLVWLWRAPPKWLSRGSVNTMAVTQLPVLSSFFSSRGVVAGADRAVFCESLKKLQEPVVVAAAAVLGLLIYPFLARGSRRRCKRYVTHRGTITRQTPLPASCAMPAASPSPAR